MRVVVANEKGVQFYTNILKEEPMEEYCSCSRRGVSSNRHVELKEDNVYITIPDKEYAAIILRKAGSDDKPLHQFNPNGVSIYTTSKYMVWVRFASSYQDALRYLHKKHSLPMEEDKYIVSVKKIDKIQEKPSSPSEIFVFESSFGDVFSMENYSGETTSGDQQMFNSLKRSSYSGLSESYPTCWI